ncbi:putative lipase [Phytophthora cinnamomi]|uniref:putative lipase n=1 Tax=Phytophthora cinnamomi TaxID=4785 RepID=UPI00355A83D3|nr:putative lipase [Phytophthora cinnamomi]
MLSLFTGLLFVIASPLLVLADNSYPIVLVHGFGGWGRDEFFGFKYWGGFHGDFQEDLVKEGYTVYTASIGPFSSNWDRACELYAQIKGGVVDYGANHSAAHGHARFGRNYSALYPKWGEVDETGTVNKVHLVGHSMGGQTIRMLTQMLEKGTIGAPVEEDSSSHPLFEGGKSWVHSITTIASPNQGTTLADGFSVIGDGVKDALAGILSVVGVGGDTTKAIFDAQLDQWNISVRADGETISKYFDRVFSSKLFDPSFDDTCLWSLSHAGALEENSWVSTLDDVYYYSYATVDTFSMVNFKFKKIALPHPLSMNPAFDALSVFLGSRYAPDTLHLTTDWQPNDGVVNTISMSHDGVGELVKFSGTSQIGKWVQMEQLTGLDHMDITGFSLFRGIKDIYSSLAKLVTSLPADSEARSITFNKEVHTSVNGAISSLVSARSRVQTVDDVKKLCKDSSTSYAKKYCATLLKQARKSKGTTTVANKSSNVAKAGCSARIRR